MFQIGIYHLKVIKKERMKMKIHNIKNRVHIILEKEHHLLKLMILMIIIIIIIMAIMRLFLNPQLKKLKHAMKKWLID